MYFWHIGRLRSPDGDLPLKANRLAVIPRGDPRGDLPLPLPFDEDRELRPLFPRPLPFLLDREDERDDCLLDRTDCREGDRPRRPALLGV